MGLRRALHGQKGNMCYNECRSTYLQQLRSILCALLEANAQPIPPELRQGVRIGGFSTALASPLFICGHHLCCALSQSARD